MACIMTNDIPNQKRKTSSWMKDHSPNLTGTPFAYEYKDKKKPKK